MTLLDKQFVFVFGKGGVGKSVTAASLAVAAAQRGKRVLVVLANVRESMSALLGTTSIGPEISTVYAGVDAVNVDPGHALREYGAMLLPVRALHHAVFGNRAVEAFLRGTPGMEAWAILGKAYFHATEALPKGSPRYDLVVFDAPATGHALDMLRVPVVLERVAPPGILRREAERALALFRDPARTASLIVSLPEEMPTTESLELRAALQRDVGLKAIEFVVNQVHTDLASPAVVAKLERVHFGPEGAPIARAITRRARRRTIEVAAIGRLESATGAAPRTFPFVARAPLGPREIEELAGHWRP